MSKEQELLNKIERAEGLLCGLVLRKPSVLIENVINPNMLSENAQFYIGMTNRLLKKDIEVVDEVHFSEEVYSIGLTSKYNELGGWQTVKELQNIASPQNEDSIIDEFLKWNLVKTYNKKGILDIEKHWDKILIMKSSQIPDYIMFQATDVDIQTMSDIEFSDLNITDSELQSMIDGENMGIYYGKYSPILNYLSLGLPLRDLTMISSYTNGGKSSFVTANIIIPSAEDKIKSVIISNEQQAMVYKLLLLNYVLVNRLNYHKLPRKKIKTGKWTEEEGKIINKARKIIRDEYAPYIHFAKIYDYDMGKVKKIAQREAKLGTTLLIYDTMKYSGDGDGVWQALLNDSKELFQIVSKLGMAGVVTFQLYAGTKNKIRILDESCLSNAKQVAEVFSEMIAFRDIWDDEWDGEDCEIKPYRLKKDSNGKYTGDREYIPLNKKNSYKIFFHFKTRNDSAGTQLCYQFSGHDNTWKEIGYCNVHGKNRY